MKVILLNVDNKSCSIFPDGNYGFSRVLLRSDDDLLLVNTCTLANINQDYMNILKLLAIAKDPLKTKSDMVKLLLEMKEKIY